MTDLAGKVSITLRHWLRLAFCLLLPAFSVNTKAQTIAVLTPESNVRGTYAEILTDELSQNFTVLDDSLAVTAFAAIRPPYPFNMTSDEAKTAAAAIGCDLLVLVRTETQRRTSFEKPEYYESTAVIYVIGSRNGGLRYWTIRSSEAASPLESEAKLHASAMTFAREFSKAVKDSHKLDIADTRPAGIPEPPLPGTPDAIGFVAPIPFSRIKPEYTKMAYLYSVTATVEILVDLDEAGNVKRTEIVRWAGYSLEESVEKAVRAMSWRPAERNKKPLPMRILLRYNFKKADARP